MGAAVKRPHPAFADAKPTVVRLREKEGMCLKALGRRAFFLLTHAFADRVNGLFGQPCTLRYKRRVQSLVKNLDE